MKKKVQTCKLYTKWKLYLFTTKIQSPLIYSSPSFQSENLKSYLIKGLSCLKCYRVPCGFPDNFYMSYLSLHCHPSLLSVYPPGLISHQSKPELNRVAVLIYLHCILLMQESLSTGGLSLVMVAGYLGPGL